MSDEVISVRDVIGSAFMHVSLKAFNPKTIVLIPSFVASFCCICPSDP